MKEQKEMEALLQRAACGDAYAMYSVGVHYGRGTNGFQEDYTLSRKWYKQAHAHEAGSIEGTAAYGFHLWVGKGGDKCLWKGAMYLGIAAAQGSDYAAYNLGMGLAGGKFGMNVDEKEAIRWLQQAV